MSWFNSLKFQNKTIYQNLICWNIIMHELKKKSYVSVCSFLFNCYYVIYNNNTCNVMQMWKNKWISNRSPCCTCCSSILFQYVVLASNHYYVNSIKDSCNIMQVWQKGLISNRSPFCSCYFSISFFLIGASIFFRRLLHDFFSHLMSNRLLTLVSCRYLFCGMTENIGIGWE